MISKLLSNVNNLVNYFVIFIILLLVTYAIYKIIIIEGEVYVVSERLHRIETEYMSKDEGQQLEAGMNNEDFNMANIIMNEIFTPHIEKTVPKSCKKDEPPTSIDLDDIICSPAIPSQPDNSKDDDIIKDEIFDLKKELIADDRESIVSSSIVLTKKRLQKLSAEKLKDKCIELGLSADGTKAQMIERLVEDANKE